jgi:ubiquinone/menaquinone biosynthesis C-methylase UbiE
MTTPKDILGQISGGRVLDVATGSGQFISFLLEGLPAWDEIIGIDTSEKGEAAFAENFKEHPNVRIIKMDAAKMDFADASFDTVCISNSLHHMENLQPVLSEMIRVLRSPDPASGKPGGYFIVAEMYRDNQTETQMTHVLMHHWWGAIDTARGVVHNETYTRQQMLDIVLGLGLQEVTIHDWSDLSDDPKNPETVKYLTNVVDQYLTRIEGLPEESQLRARGLELRQRVEEIGFHSATSLFVIAKKVL